MDAIHKFVVRDNSASNDALSPTMVDLLIALLVLVFAALLLIAGLFILRNYRKSKREASLPLYNEKIPSGKKSNHRRLTITAAPYGRRSESIYIYNDKQDLLENSSSPPESPIPEIRITFPEEEDEAGKRMSGRVVVVRVGDAGVGLEPLDEENLPPYQRSDSERYQSVDLERVGGLRENIEKRWT
ncbi:MAG: hypothetical protein M1827_003570 [Pycnora praestabilis]|nr:MAG: hypothetical protein M1827_003570 [Pycnora praestabilis]